MKNNVILINFNKNVEEEYVVSIAGVEIITFSHQAIFPFGMKLGNTISANLSISWIEDHKIEILNNKKYGLERIPGNYFGYFLYGKLLEDNILDLGKFKIMDELFANFQHLKGKFIKVPTDRINIEFLEEI